MTTTPARADAEKLRQRLNLLVLVVPGQFIPIVAAYWLRLLPAFRPTTPEVTSPPPSVLLTCAAALLLPFCLPRGWFQPRNFERGRLYRALGLRFFRAVAPDGDWINSRVRRLDPGYRVIRDRRSRDEHLAGTILNERWHTAWLLLGLATAWAAMTSRPYAWAITVTIFNVAFNLYPVWH